MTDNRPKLLIVNPDHPVASDFDKFEKNYARQKRLCSETSYLMSLFTELSLMTWTHLDITVNTEPSSISKMAFKLGVWLKKPFPMISHIFMNCSLLSIHFVSPGSILGLFFFLVEQFLSTSYPDLVMKWNNYLAIFREYCSVRNLKGYTSVFFQVEDENVFLLEVDEHYYNFTLSDIEGLCNSLSIALDCMSFSLSTSCNSERRLTDHLPVLQLL